MKVIETSQAPSAIGTYSQAVSQSGFVFVSGQIPLDPETMEVVSLEADKQITQVFKNIEAICTAADASLDQIVKLTVYLTDLDLFPEVNEQMSKLFTKPYPARAAVEVSKLPKGVLVEIDAIISVN